MRTLCWRREVTSKQLGQVRVVREVAKEHVRGRRGGASLRGGQLSMLSWKNQDKATVQVLMPHHNIVALADRRDYFLEWRFAFLSLETVGKMFHKI